VRANLDAPVLLGEVGAAQSLELVEFALVGAVECGGNLQRAVPRDRGLQFADVFVWSVTIWAANAFVAASPLVVANLLDSIRTCR
jgi:hypothetical protein